MVYSIFDKVSRTVDPLRTMFPAISPSELALLAKQDQGPKVVALVILFTVIALICVLLRFVARIRFTRLTGWEDYFIAISMVRVAQCFLGFITLTCTRPFPYSKRYVKSNKYNGAVASTKCSSIFLRP
jgi:nitrate reductase gamma subunit